MAAPSMVGLMEWRRGGRLGAYTDRDLERKIVAAQKDLQAWAVTNDLWYDSGFTSYATRVQGEPGEGAVVFILYSQWGARTYAG